MYAKFLEERLKASGHEKISIFHSVKYPELKTGLEKPKKVTKVLTGSKRTDRHLAQWSERTLQQKKQSCFPNLRPVGTIFTRW